MKKIPRKLIWTLGIVLGLILLTALGLRLFFPAEKVQAMAVKMASDKLGREVSVQQAGLSFSGGLGVKLDGVQVANPAGFLGEPLLVADKIDLKLQLRPLIKGEFQVNRLVVAQPRIRLHRREDGTDNFTFDFGKDPAAGDGLTDPGSTEPKADLAVSFESLEFQQGRLTYFDAGTGQGVDLEELSLSGSLTNPQPGIFRSSGLVAVDSLRVIGPQPLPTLPAEVNYELSFDASRRVLELEKGASVLGGQPLGLTGTMVTVPDSLVLTGVCQATDLDLTDLLDFLTPEQRAPLETVTLSGKVDLETDFEFIQTRAEPVGYEGKARIADLRASSDQVEGELEAEEVHLAFRPDHLDLKSAGGSFSGRPCELSLNVDDFENPRVTGEVSGNVDLAILKPFLPPEKEATLSGRGQIEGRFSGRTENPTAMDYSGRAVFTDLSYADNTLPDTLEKLNGTVVFNPDSVVVKKTTAQFGGGDVTLTGKIVDHLPFFLPTEKDNRDKLKKPTFTFAAHSNRIDIDRLYPPAAPAAGGSGGGAALPETLATIPDLLGQGTIQADTLIYSQVPFTGIDGKVRLKNRILECYDVSGRVYGGGVTGRVTIDLKNLNDPGYDGHFEAVDIEANNFLTRFTSLSQVVFGKTGMTGSFSARGREPDRIKSTLTMESLAALTSGKVVPGQFVNSSLGTLAAGVGQSLDKEQALKDLTTLIKVENGRVGLDNFQTKLGNFGDLTLGGSYGFDGGLDYRGALLLTKEQTARLYATGGLVGSVAGLFGKNAERLSLPMTVNGTMTRPKMDIDYTELTGNLKSQLQDGLTDEVKNRLKGLWGK